ncbi:MAG: hypothetical protein HY002_21665, partial [Candidatus Rokubacteria bacterium]|nr:hypothetical protein [Candidatus Rokubacteria bacterium]
MARSSSPTWSSGDMLKIPPVPVKYLTLSSSSRILALAWSSGKVGMIGGSYLGWVQWWAASQKPPHLVTIIPNVAPPDPFYNVPYEYGTFFLMGAMFWAEALETRATADL